LAGGANMAWAFAVVNRNVAQLFAGLARTAERRLREFNVLVVPIWHGNLQ